MGWMFCSIGSFDVQVMMSLVVFNNAAGYYNTENPEHNPFNTNFDEMDNNLH